MSKGIRTKFYADIMAFHPRVTGSSFLIVVKSPDGTTSKFMVDCGLFQEERASKQDYKEDRNVKLFCNPEELDFALVTHNHVDHTGRLPYLIKKGFYKSIYMTQATSALVPLALNDSCSVLRDVGKRNNFPPLYNTEHVQRTIEKIVPCQYNATTIINEGIRTTFFENGHLPGSALILVQISYPGYEDINILFTGDYNNKNMFFDVAPLPDWVRKLPITVVQEATYGDVNSNQMNEKCYEDNVINAINDGKTVLTLVFSLGRSQELLYTIKKMQDNGRLSKSIPIYFDGKLAFQYTEMYRSGKLNLKEEMKDFLPENLIYVDKLIRPNILYDESPKIILSTSGMGSYGPAQTYIPELLRRKKALIHFTGYTAEGTLGSRLKNTPKGEVVDIGGLLVVKQADVEYTTEYSAHAKADEMIEFLQQFSNLRMVLVNHGETETKKVFANTILKQVDTKYVGILGEGYLFRVNSYGFVKTMSTKFE